MRNGYTFWPGFSAGEVAFGKKHRDGLPLLLHCYTDFMAVPQSVSDRPHMLAGDTVKPRPSLGERRPEQALSRQCDLCAPGRCQADVANQAGQHKLQCRKPCASAHFLLRSGLFVGRNCTGYQLHEQKAFSSVLLCQPNTHLGKTQRLNSNSRGLALLYFDNNFPPRACRQVQVQSLGHRRLCCSTWSVVFFAKSAAAHSRSLPGAAAVPSLCSRHSSTGSQS